MNFGDIPSVEFQNRETKELINNIKQIIIQQSDFNTQTNERLNKLEKLSTEKNQKKDNTYQIISSLGVIGVGIYFLFKELNK